MSRWYLDENDKDIYFRDDKGIRWDYNIKEIVRILNGQEERLAKSVVFPKLEKDNAHKGAWYIYEIDDKGDIMYTHFHATKKEAEQELFKLTHQHKDKGE